VRRAEDLPRDRVEQAGADLLRISETEVLVVTDDSAYGEPWHHPAWALCRGLGSLGFGCVHLRGAEAFRDELSLLMEGFPFTHEAAAALGAALPERAPAREIVVYLGRDPELRGACARLARS